MSEALGSRRSTTVFFFTLSISVFSSFSSPLFCLCLLSCFHSLSLTLSISLFSLFTSLPPPILLPNNPRLSLPTPMPMKAEWKGDDPIPSVSPAFGFDLTKRDFMTAFESRRRGCSGRVCRRDEYPTKVVLPELDLRYAKCNAEIMHVFRRDCHYCDH